MDLVSSVQNLLGQCTLRAATSSVFVDNAVFALHHKFTSAILIICSLYVAFHQFLLNPITCNPIHLSPDVINTECWMKKSFSFPLFYSKMPGFNALYPGIKPKEPQIYHAYYQSIFFILFIQAVLFYSPGHFWKVMERGRIKKLVSGLRLDYPALPEETKRIGTRLLEKYFLSSLHSNGMYCFYFVVAEILNFINVVVQICLINNAFDGDFTTHGLKVFQFSEKESYERNDTISEIFPKSITCTIYGLAGTGDDISKYRTMCLLPINEVSEKIYIFVWFWLLILAILSGLALVYRSAVILSPWVRFFALKSRSTISRDDDLKIIAAKISFGDWFMLDLVAKNVDPQNFKAIVHDLAEELDDKYTLLAED